MNCRHASRLISEGLDRSLSWFERGCLGAHLLACWSCRRFRHAVTWLHLALAFAPSTARLSPKAWDRIRRALEQAAREE
jgi:hypothetical protein